MLGCLVEVLDGRARRYAGRLGRVADLYGHHATLRLLDSDLNETGEIATMDRGVLVAVPEPSEIRRARVALRRRHLEALRAKGHRSKPEPTIREYGSRHWGRDVIFEVF